MIFTLLILAIGGFLSPVLCKSYMFTKRDLYRDLHALPHKPFCVLEGVLEEEWGKFFNIINCGGPNKSCEPTMLETLPTIGKSLG